MSPRHEPTSSRRGGFSRREESSRSRRSAGAPRSSAGDEGGESRRRGGSRHSVAQTDPLYWARARAAENDPSDDPFAQPPYDQDPYDQDPYDRDPFGRDRADSEAATEEFPSVSPDWSGRLPLPVPTGLPPLPAWSGEDDRPSLEDATTDSLAIVRPDDAATTVDLPAVDALTETVDYRDRPLALVPRSDRALVPVRPDRSDRSVLARRNYTGRHRPPETVAPVRLGLSTVGMTVAVGVLGVTLAMLHAQPSDQVNSGAPPLAAVSPTGTPESGTAPDEDSATADGTRPTPGPSRHLIPRPGASPTPGDATPRAGRAGTPAVAPDAAAAGGDPAGGDTSGGDEPDVRNAPARPSRPTRTSRPDNVVRPTPRCAAPQNAGTAAARALAADATATASAGTQADPTDESGEPTEEPTEEATDEASPTASPGRC